MQFIPILPINHLSWTAGHYVLSLAHLYSNKRYGRFFAERKRKGRFVILDNAAYELPEPLGMNTLWEIIVYFGASELVLPDVLKDRQATDDKTREALEFLAWQDKKNRLQQHLQQVMIVPQGTDMVEWIVSLDSLLSAVQTYTPKMHITIGIAKHTSAFSGGRLKILDYLFNNEHMLAVKYHAVHLLGINEDLELLREIALTFGAKVRSVDSARPGVYAAAGIFCRYGEELPAIHRPPQYFELNLFGAGFSKFSARLRNNIALYDWITKQEEELSWEQQRYS